MTDAEILAALDDRRTLALTMYGEARGVPRDDDSHSPVEELIAVGMVVRNRRARFTRWRAVDASFRSICLAPAQFSCWNAGIDANHLAVMGMAEKLAGFPVVPVTDASLRECLYLADGVIAGVFIDRTGGATSYFAPAAMKPAGTVPMWAINKPTLLIGNQRFLNI